MTPATRSRTAAVGAAGAVGAGTGPHRTAGRSGRSLRGGRSGWPAQLVRFGVAGGAASVVQLALYAFWADWIGSQPANVACWLVSTVLATEAHRRYTFGPPSSGAETDHAVGILTAVFTLLLSTLALAALGDPPGITGVLALVAVNVTVGSARFVVLRRWMLGRRAASPVAAADQPHPAPGARSIRHPSAGRAATALRPAGGTGIGAVRRRL